MLERSSAFVSLKSSYANNETAHRKRTTLVSKKTKFLLHHVTPGERWTAILSVT
jgi:hypothetical protein